MSWEIDKSTSAVTMHRGDTGAYYVQLRRKSGEDFEEGDVALYTVKAGNEVKIAREYALDDDDGAGNGRFLIAFINSDTDTWPAGTYNTEIRVARNPLRNNKSMLSVAPAERGAGVDPITAELDTDTLLAYVTTDSGTVVFTYTSSWSATLADYGITVTGTPISGDVIIVSWNKNGDGEVKDGSTIRTIKGSQSTITILGVLKEI